MSPALLHYYRLHGGDGTMQGWADVFAQIIPQAAQVGAQYYAASQQQHAGEAQVNNQFDQAARQVTQFFQQVSAKGNSITAADFQQAVSYYQQLAQLAQQSPTRAIQEWWNSPAYSAAYQHSLDVFAQRLQGQGVATGTGAGTTQTGGAGTTQTASILGFDTSTLLLVGVALVAVMALKK